MPARRLPATWARRTLAVVAAVALAACTTSEGRPIEYGATECAYCRMRISDPRFGARLVTRTGKVHEFDSVECLAGFYATLRDAASVRGVWVSDYTRPGTLVPAAAARFGRLAGPGSPMGHGLFAVAEGSPLPAAAKAAPAMTWSDVVSLAQRGALAPDAPRPPLDHHDAPAPDAVVR